MSAFASLVCLAGQVSEAAADTFNWDVQFNSHFDVPGGSVEVINPPIGFAWNFEFDPVVASTDVQDNLPASLRTFATFAGAGITTASTPLTADIWTNVPAGATFTHSTYGFGNQAYYSFCNCVLRDFTIFDEWMSGDVDADPNVDTTYQYFRSFGLGTQTAETPGDIATFDASSIIDFVSVAASPGYTASFSESLRITTWNRTTGEVTSSQKTWSGPAAFASHVPGSPTPVPEPASIVLVATGLVATAVRKRRRLC